MSHGHKVCCVLCLKSKETKTTGPLSTKDDVTAHQNCLLYASGIYCRESPTFHDLFGFCVEDVQEEVKRGSKLTCDKCKKRGATVGCEVKRCKRSYHYPCALKARAEILEDQDKGTFGLYCNNHCQQQMNARFTCARTNPDIPSSTVEAGPSQMNGNGDSAVAGPSGLGSSSRWLSRKPSKRRLVFADEHDETSSKRQSVSRNRIVSDSSTDSGSSKPDADLNIYAPIESDLDDDCLPEPEQLVRENPGGPAGSTSGSPPQNEQREDSHDGEEMSGLPTVSYCPVVVPTAASHMVMTGTSPAQPQATVAEVEEEDCDGLSPDEQSDEPPQHSEQPSPSSDHMPSLRLSSSASSSPPPNVPSDPQPRTIDSASFWKGCNAAGCTQAIFSNFIRELNDLCGRIQCEQASQEDYDLALSLVEASGKLTELMVKQQKELQRNLEDLQKAAAAMEVVVSALNIGAPL